METLNIVIPVYNEQERLSKTFKALYELQLPCGLKLEKVIFVNDGSSDGTEKIIESFIQFLHRPRSSAGGRITSEVSLNSCTVGGVSLRHTVRGVPAKRGYRRRSDFAYKIKLVSYEKNRGKGYAVKKGMEISISDYTLICDADMSTPLSEIEKFMPYIRKNIPVIIGTRKNGKSTVLKHQSFIREALGRGFTILSSIVLNTWVTDFTCGFKVFSKKTKETIFSNMRISRWGFDSEIVFLTRIFNHKMVEVPVVWSNDERSKVNLIIDLPKSFIELFQIRISQIVGLYGASLSPFVFSPSPAFSRLFRSIRMFLF